MALNLERLLLGNLVEVLRVIGEPVLYRNLILSALCLVDTATDAVLYNTISGKANSAELILCVPCKLYSGLWLKWVTEERDFKNPPELLYYTLKKLMSVSKQLLTLFPTRCII